MLLDLRAEEVTKRIIPRTERFAESSVAFVLSHARLYRVLTGLARVFQRPIARRGSLRVPRRLNPVGDRQLPALAKRSFRDMWDEIK
jgi:hypothetical protein